MVDGVTLGRTLQFLTDLDDIERIEVLRGPQGTLFGKNASGGLVNIISKRPTDEFEAALGVRISSDDSRRLSAMVSGTLAEGIRGRLALYNRDWDGFITNIEYDRTLNGDNSEGFRGQLEMDVKDNGTFLMIADYSNQERDCCIAVPIREGLSRFYEYDWRNLEDIGKDNTETVGGPDDPYTDLETMGLSGEFNFNFDKFDLVSITAWRGTVQETQQEVDLIPYTDFVPGGPTNFLGAPQNNRIVLLLNGTPPKDQNQWQFSQEFRVSANVGDRVSVTGGLFYWEQNVDRHFLRELLVCGDGVLGSQDSVDGPDDTTCEEPFQGAGPLVGLGTGYGYFNSGVDFTNWALFGQVDVQLMDQLSLNFGLRYTSDEIDAEMERTTRDPGLAVAASTDGELRNSVDETNVSGKLALIYDLSDEVMFYGSAATGYKAPAFDLIFGATPRRLRDPVPEETNTSIEFGTKTELLDNRLRLSAAIFYTEFEGLQGQGFDPDQLAFVLTSAGNAITQGVEIDITAKPNDHWLLRAGIAYVDAYYDDYPAFNCYGGMAGAEFRQTFDQGCNVPRIDAEGMPVTNAQGQIYDQSLSDKDIPNSPDLKFTLQGRYDFLLEGAFDAFFNVNYRWQDERVGSVDQDPRLFGAAYGVLDFTFGFEDTDGNWTFEVFVKNLLDDHYLDTPQGFDLFNQNALTALQARDAYRYWGAEYQYRIGAF